MPDTPQRDPALIPAIRVQTDCHIWAIDPRCLAALADMDGTLIEPPMLAATADARGQGNARAGGVATVPLHGILMPAAGGLFALFFGGGGLESFQAGLDEAVADPDVDVIVMDVDSPGGVVDQIPETAAAIRRARAKKPIVAVSNCQMDSAAYWLAAQADEISVTPSGEAGSVGVYQLHRDASGMYEQRGILHTLIYAGDRKVNANPYEPLGDDARTEMQEDVDDYYRMFVREVARGRRVDVPPMNGQAFGAGRAFHAKQAVSAGLADRVETLPDAVRRVGTHAGRAALDRRREAGPSAEELLAPIVAEREEQIPPNTTGGDAVVTYTSDERNRLLAVLA